MTVMCNFVHSPSYFVAYDHACIGMKVARRSYWQATDDIKKLTHRWTCEHVFLELSSDAAARGLRCTLPLRTSLGVSPPCLWERCEKCDQPEKAAFQRDPEDTCASRCKQLMPTSNRQQQELQKSCRSNHQGQYWLFILTTSTVTT
jgi:hypothetical protein